MRQIVECVANFSEGRDASVIDRIAESISRGHGATVLHRTSDPDHHRSVITFAGTPEGIVAAAVRAVGKAVELIDLTRHTGQHPRLGAADVVPFVPVEGISLEECARLAWQAGEEIWRTHHVPVYFYEAAANSPARRRLENVRRGEFELIQQAVLSDPERRPDVGGPELHPTAGAVIVGARKFLIAWNVNLHSGDLHVAREIARAIRESSGGLPAVKALGMTLASRGQVQVSVNLTDHELTPLTRVFEAISAEAARRNIRIAGSEIIGLIPRAVIESGAEAYFRFENFTPQAVIERRVEEALPIGFSELFAQAADPARSTGGGSAAAVAAAMAASLGEKVAALIHQDTARLADHRQFFTDAIARDAEAFAALMRTADPPAEAMVEATEVPVAIAERAHVLCDNLSVLSDQTPDRLLSDIHMALLLARAARDGALSTARLNVARIRQEMVRRELEKRMWTIQ